MSDRKNNEKQHKCDSRVFTALSHIGFTVIAGLLIGALSGSILDHVFGTLPMLFLLFSSLGMIAAYVVIFFIGQRLILKTTRKERGD